MKPLRGKLRTQRGASVAVALLIFLICSVVGSIVLTAGTGAMGTLSRQPQLDRSRYSVSSAARLLQQMLGDETYTIVRERIEQNGQVRFQFSLPPADRAPDPLRSASLAFVFGTAEVSPAALGEADYARAPQPPLAPLELPRLRMETRENAAPGEEPPEALTVDIAVRLCDCSDADAELLFILGADSDVQMTLRCHARVVDDSDRPRVRTLTGDDPEQTATVTTKTTRLTWDTVSLEYGGEEAAA